MHIRKLAALSLVLSLLAAGAALAQDHERNWSNGHVVVVTHVQTEPGMFNAYINDLDNVWRKFMEAQKEDGSVISYGMYSNAFAREGEPDLILTVTYKDWSAFNRGPDYFEEISKKLMGGPEEMREAGVDREALRKIGSTLVLQEVKFND